MITDKQIYKDVRQYKLQSYIRVSDVLLLINKKARPDTPRRRRNELFIPLFTAVPLQMIDNDSQQKHLTPRCNRRGRVVVVSRRNYAARGTSLNIPKS